MATLPGLRVSLTLDSAQFIAAINRVGSSVDGMTRQITTSTSILKSFFAAAGVGSLLLLARQVARTADGYAVLGARLRLVTTDAAEAERVQRQLLGIANETRTSLGDTAGLYTKLALTLRETGVSSEALVAATRTVGQAVKLSGVEASAASAGLIQFAQAMGSGRLSGDELRSVLEQLPALAKAIADGLGVPIGQLRKLGEAGALTTTKVLTALQKQAPEIAAQFRSIPLTIGDSFTKLGTSLSLLVGSSDQATGASKDLARAISDLADLIGSSDFINAFQTVFAQALREIRREFELLATAGREIQDVLVGLGLSSLSLDQLNLRIGETNEQIAELLTQQEKLRAAAGTFSIDPESAFAVQEAERQIIALQEQRQALIGQREALTQNAKAHKDVAAAIVPVIEQTEALSEKHAELLKNTIAENAGLQRLSDAYHTLGASIQDIEDSLTVEGKLRSAKITLVEAENSGLLEQLTINQQLERSNKALAESVAVQDELAQIQAQIAARGRETEELRIQLAIFAARSKFGAAYTHELEREIVALEEQRTILDRVNASRDLDETIAQQRLLIKFGGQETEAYRIQIRMLELKKQLNGEITPEMEQQVRILEQQATQIEAAQESQELFTEAFKNAGAEIQREMVDTFERIFNGGVTSFSDLASEIKDIFIRLAAELAVLMIIRPQVALAGLAGLTGAAGQAGQFGGLTNVGQPGAFAGLTNALNTFGQRLGFATPASQPALPGAQPGDITGFIPSKAGTILGTNATLSQTLGAGAIGVVGGTIVGGLFGGQGAVGGGIGGGLGAAAGFALGGPVGALIGGGAGSLLGGAIGSLFGGGNEEAMGSLRFRSTPGGAFTGGPFGGFEIGGEDTFQAPLADMLREFDKNVAEFLTDRQIQLAARAVQSLGKFDKRFPEADPSKGFSQILEARATTVLTAAFPKLKIAEALEGVNSAQDIAERVQKILETIKTYNELIGTTSPGIEAARKQLTDLRDGFSEVREGARALGLSVRDLNRAEREAVRSLKQGVQAQIDDLLSGGQSQAASQFRQEMDALRARFDSVRDSAIGLGLSIEGLGKAEREAAKQLRQASRQRIDAALAGGTGGAQLSAEIARINAEFTELKNLARELPGTTRATLQGLNEAAKEARQAVRSSARQSIFDLIATAGSGSTGTAAGRLRSDLAALAKAFDEARATAAQLTFHTNINAQLNAAEATARQALRAEARSYIDDLMLGSDAVGEYRRELQRIQEQYTDAKDLARELGISITALNTAQRQAAKDFADAAQRELEGQALGISRQFDAILNPLREFQAELKFSVASPVEQFRLAREEFERIAALARGGDLAAIAALPQAGRLFLEQATAFGASPGRVTAEQQIQTALNGVIQATTQAQADATKGLEAEIRRASDREVDKLSEMLEQGRETVRELQRLRAAINQSRTA